MANSGNTYVASGVEVAALCPNSGISTETPSNAYVASAVGVAARRSERNSIPVVYAEMMGADHDNLDRSYVPSPSDSVHSDLDHPRKIALCPRKSSKFVKDELNKQRVCKKKRLCGRIVVCLFTFAENIALGAYGIQAYFFFIGNAVNIRHIFFIWL